METRLIEVNKISYQDKDSGYIVLYGTELKPRKRRRKKSDPYAYGNKARYVGLLPVAILGDWIECEVEMAYSHKYGTQYKIISAVRKSSAPRTQIEAFLRRNIKGMTPVRLDQIMTKYGENALNEIQKNPRAFDFTGLSSKDSDALRDACAQMAAYEKVLILLRENEVDCRYSAPLYRKYGTTAPHILTNSPYIPYTDGIYDFRVADRLYVGLGYPGDGIKRCRIFLLALLQQDAEKNGNLFVRRERLKEKMEDFLVHETDAKARILPFADQTIEDALQELVDSRQITITTKYGSECIYLGRNYHMEEKAAAGICRVWTGQKNITFPAAGTEELLTAFASNHGYILAPEQSQAVLTALTSPISIISGGPGTGKTFTVKVIVDFIRELVPDVKITACAPTGRAALRLKDMTGLPASTIHRVLNLGPFSKNVLGPGELVCDYLIVDEFSMVDIELCQYLFTALTPSARVIITGDHNQLPSVGPGTVLRDLIASNIFPTTILSHVFRQAEHSGIIGNANRIFAPPDSNRKLTASNPKKPGGDFYFLEENDTRKIAAKIEEIIQAGIRDYALTLSEIQVLAPIHSGDTGTDNLNSYLQEKLNPSTEVLEYNGRTFHRGDKVIHTKNDYELDLFNGEIGFICDVGCTKDCALIVDYSGREVVYPENKLDQLELAYALTVHKMQGSECPLIIMPIYGPYLSKNVVYTAITRAQKAVVLIGSKENLAEGLQQETAVERESNLVKRLQAQILHMTFTPAVPQLPPAMPQTNPPENPSEEEQLTLFD